MCIICGEIFYLKYRCYIDKDYCFNPACKSKKAELKRKGERTRDYDKPKVKKSLKKKPKNKYKCWCGKPAKEGWRYFCSEYHRRIASRRGRIDSDWIYHDSLSDLILTEGESTCKN